MANAKIEFLKPGTRTALAGRSGSGKSTLAAYMLAHSKQKWLIVDPKNDDKIATLKPVRLPKLTLTALLSAWEKSQYVTITHGDADDIDSFILLVFETLENWGLAIDELYFMGSNGRAGDGLIAVLTRGRSGLVTFLGCTQRPAWVTPFVFSEANYILQGKLNIDKDRDRVYTYTGKPQMRQNPTGEYGTWLYDVKLDKLILINGE